MDIQLNPNPQQDEPTIDLGSGKGFNIPSQAAASGTAAKASFGLGNLMGVPYDDFYASIANGQEPQMREQAASTADASVAKRKQALVTQAVAAGQNPSPILTEPKTTDPDSVVEEYAASKYFQPMLDSTDVDKTIQANSDAINAGVSNLTYKNYAITRLQKSLDGYKNESWTDWTEDQIKSLSQFYTEWKTRGGTGDLTKLLGSDLEEQRQKAYSMPFDQYKQWLDQRMDQLDKDNPTLALAFGAAIVGQSNYAIDQDNATTLLGIPSDLSVVGGLAADVFKSVRAVRAAVQGVVKSSDIIDPKTAEALDKATNLGSNVNVNGKPWNSNPKDITPEDIKQAQAAGHGNQGDAAIQTVSKYITNTFEQKENVTQEVKSLPAIFKTDIDSVTQNTGNLGNDIANRIKEQFLQRGVDITGALTELLRVNRIPVAVASEDFARAAREWVKGKYSGANSTVLDGSGSNILLDAPSNTYHVNINIGNHDNEYFKNEAEAVSHAEQYGLGLQEPPTSERQYWDDEATAAAFEVDHIKTQLKKYEGYTKQQFKPQAYYDLQKRLKEQNARKKNAWAQRAGAYWKPNQPMAEKLGKITLEKQGLGWYIQGWVPLDETATFARDALLKMPDAYSGPRGLSGKVRSGTLTPYLQDLVTGTESNRLLASAKVWLDQPFGEKIEPLVGLRSPEETLSPEENIQRKVATHTPGALADKIFGPDAKIVQSIPKRYTGDIKRLLIANQNMIDPVTSEHGYFFKNIGDVEDWYQNNTGRFPSAEEVEGYFAYTRMYETERVLRTMAMLRNKWRSGVESWKVKIGKEWTKEFDAVKRTELPTAFEKSPVYIAIDGGDVVKESGQYTKELRERFAQGKVQVLELWNREDRPFHGLSKTVPHNTEPRYVITDQANTRPISPENQVPRRGGGHWVFPYDHYVRQANTYLDPVTKQWVYKGDTVAMPFQNVSLGRQWAMKMNEVQNLMREGMIDDAREFVKNLGVGGLNFDDHVWPMFKPVRDKPARFNMHEPFVLTPTDKTVMSLSNELKDRYADKGGLLDTTRYGNMARNHTVEFTGERDAHDLHTIEDSGTTRNPVYSYRPTQFADPIDVLNRGITRISNSLWLDDMKYFSSEHWYKTYENWLDTDKGGSPFYHFINPIWKEGVPTGVKELAMSNRKKAMEFVRQYSPLANWARKNMAEAVGAIYNVSGPKAYNMFRPLEELVSEKNPVSALRSLTADIKIGLGSLPAFFMQASAYANIAALEPRFVGAATRAMMLDVYAEFIPQHIDHLDRLASANLGGLTGQVGFNPGHFKHLWDGLNKSDFRHVGSEHAFMNFALSDRYMKSFHDSLRYWGSTAFREGAQGVRRGAWYTSGLKWIEDNDGRLPQTRDDWAKVMDYAGMLDHNMSRASNSAINSGMMSVPAQFYTYDRNIAEIMWGKRVTPQQKARLFVTSSILWGLPYGGLGLLGLPLGYEAYKNYSEYAKYVPGYNTVESLAMEGLLSYLGALATGKGDPRKGTWYDFSRYGVKGWGLLAGLFSDDSRWWTLLGAAPSVVINTISRMSPLMGDLSGLMHGVKTGDYSKFNPAAEDFADLMKEWVGFNQGHKLWVALRSQIQMSNNNTPIRDNVTTGQAITNFFTGLVPANVEGISADWGILSDRKAQQQLIVSQMSRNYNLALKEARENPDLANNSAYQAYMRKMKIILDMAPLTEQGNIMHEVYSRNKPLIEAIEDQMHKKMAGPEDQERFRKQIEMRNLQGEK